jgi:hypothetical protein
MDDFTVVEKWENWNVCFECAQSIKYGLILPITPLTSSLELNQSNISFSNVRYSNQVCRIQILLHVSDGYA